MTTILDKDKLWKECVLFMEQKCNLDKKTIDNWIKPIQIASFDSIKDDKGNILKHSIALYMPTEEFIDYVLNSYGKHIEAAFNFCLDGDKYIVDTYARNNNAVEDENDLSSAKQGYVSNLIPDFSFENFIESECNKHIIGIAKAIAAKPGQAPHNIFFLHGNSGVGKTHLCQAIGNQVARNFSNKRVYYVQCGEFSRQYTLYATVKKNVSQFIQFYQSIDVLILDDIQGLVGKEKSQNAFFEIFNHLKNLNKQIIITCDTPVVELKGMTERLRTRIQSAVMLKLENPDIILRREMLKRNFSRFGIELGDEWNEYIACNASKNMREIEGICNTFGAMGQSYITPSVIQSVVGSSVPINTKMKEDITPDYILRLIGEVFGLDKSKIIEKKRDESRVLPRQAFMYLASEFAGMSMVNIAKFLNLSSHTTVSHGKKSIQDAMSVDKDLMNKISIITSKLGV